jgi:hypothetical protein
MVSCTAWRRAGTDLCSPRFSDYLQVCLVGVESGNIQRTQHNTRACLARSTRDAVEPYRPCEWLVSKMCIPIARADVQSALACSKMFVIHVHSYRLNRRDFGLLLSGSRFLPSDEVGRSLLGEPRFVSSNGTDCLFSSYACPAPSDACLDELGINIIPAVIKNSGYCAHVQSDSARKSSYHVSG